MKGFTTLLTAALAAKAYAFPGAMLEGLGLDKETMAKFDAVERDPAEAERLMHEHQARRIESAKRSNPIEHLLTHGGGLNELGELNPFTGVLSGLVLPTPQKQGLKLIPGNDPAYRFIKPGPTDVRGMCPTLNTMANHGYISRTGITTFAEIADATQTAYGFTFDLGVFLAAVGLLAGGDLPTGIYSIGGQDSRVPNTLGPARGLDSHGVFEVDGSITRQDTYFGNRPLSNNANFLEARWKKYVETSKKYDGLFNLATNAENNGDAYDNSKATNPEFFAGVIWFVVSHAARVFTYTGLANGTNINNATYDNVAPFFLDETFPRNWYRRGVPWSLAETFMEGLKMFEQNPRVLGQNNGVDNFEPLGIDPSAMGAADIGCFLVRNFFDLNPKQLTNAFYEHAAVFKGFFAGAVLPFFTNDGFFNCNITEFTEPSASAVGSGKDSASSVGTPKNGKYPGYGFIKPQQPTTDL